MSIIKDGYSKAYIKLQDLIKVKIFTKGCQNGKKIDISKKRDTQVHNRKRKKFYFYQIFTIGNVKLHNRKCKISSEVLSFTIGNIKSFTDLKGLLKKENNYYKLYTNFQTSIKTLIQAERSLNGKKHLF